LLARGFFPVLRKLKLPIIIKPPPIKNIHLSKLSKNSGRVMKFTPALIKYNPKIKYTKNIINLIFIIKVAKHYI